MIWAHGALVATRCPVLAFTPEVESMLRWFDVTHEVCVEGERKIWRRIALPGPGAVGEQDARLMHAIELLETWHNAD